jgi:hypothetical protein
MTYEQFQQSKKIRKLIEDAMILQNIVSSKVSANPRTGVINLQLQPEKAVEYINVKLKIRPTGANFEDDL